MATLNELAARDVMRRPSGCWRSRTSAPPPPGRRQAAIPAQRAEARTRAWEMRTGDVGVTAELCGCCGCGPVRGGLKYLEPRPRPAQPGAAAGCAWPSCTRPGAVPKAIALRRRWVTTRCPGRTGGTARWERDEAAEPRESGRPGLTRRRSSTQRTISRPRQGRRREKFLATLDGMKVRPGGKELSAQYAERLRDGGDEAVSERRPARRVEACAGVVGPPASAEEFPDALARRAGLSPRPEGSVTAGDPGARRGAGAAGRHPLAKPLSLLLSYDPRTPRRRHGDRAEGVGGGRLPRAMPRRAPRRRRPPPVVLPCSGGRWRTMSWASRRRPSRWRAAPPTLPRRPEARGCWRRCTRGMGRCSAARGGRRSGAAGGHNPGAASHVARRSHTSMTDAAPPSAGAVRDRGARRVNRSRGPAVEGEARIEPLRRRRGAVQPGEIHRAGDDAAAAMERRRNSRVVTPRVAELAAAFRTRDRGRAARGDAGRADVQKDRTHGGRASGATWLRRGTRRPGVQRPP